jgi:hypothetical protein
MTKLQEKFNVGFYVIQFKAVLVVPEISNAFFSFLKEEFNADNWEFILGLQTIEQLMKKKNQTKINQQVRLLLNLYFEPNSKKELQICPEEKKLVLQKTSGLPKKEWNVDVSPLELFEPFRVVIVNEYRNDSFKRFIRTQKCYELLEKYSNNRDVLLPRLAQVYNYVDEDFEKEYMDENDFKFMKEYETDNPNWMLLKENKKKKMSYFNSPWNYFPNVQFLSKSVANVKTQILFDFSLEEVALGMFKNLDVNNHESASILHYKFGDYCILQLQLKTPIIMTKRYSKMIYKLFYDPEQRQIVMRSKSSKFKDTKWVVKDEIPLKLKEGKEKKTKGIQIFLFGSIKITEIKENQCLLEHITTMDIGSFKMPVQAIEVYFIQF